MNAFRCRLLFLVASCFAVLQLAAGTFTVGTYNLEMYLDVPALHHDAKSPEARAKVRESIKAMNADVLAVEEMGGTNALAELQGSLRKEGVNYPFSAHVGGFDTNLHVALLSKLPIVSSRFHTQDKYLLHGRRFKVTRGFGEFEVAVNPQFHVTLLAAHLKSKRAVGEGDETEMREQEAQLLREHVDDILTSDPGAHLIVLGDLNNTHDSISTRTIIGKGKTGLIDTRPAEQNGDALHGEGRRDNVRRITWTHHFAREDTYSRIDYILVSKALAHFWDAEHTHVIALPNWGVASDHRPIVAQFRTE